MGKGARGATKIETNGGVAPDEELLSILNDAKRSRTSHERGIERTMALVHAAPELFREPAEGGFFEHLTRVLVAKKRDANVERCLTFVAHIASSAVVGGGSDDACAGFSTELLTWLAAATGAADKTARCRALELCALVLESVVNAEEATVDEGVWEALVAAVVPRASDKVAAVRKAACLALRRLQDDNEAATAAVVRALESDASADVRAAAVGALDVSKRVLPSLLEKCRDVDAKVRTAAFDALRSRVGIKAVHRDVRAQVVKRGLEDRDPAVRAAAARTLCAWFASRSLKGDPVKLLEYLNADLEEAACGVALRALHASAVALEGGADGRREAPPAWLRGEAPPPAGEARRVEIFDASFYHAHGGDQDDEAPAVGALRAAMDAVDRENAASDAHRYPDGDAPPRASARDALFAAFLPPARGGDDCALPAAADLGPAAAIWLRCRVDLELAPSGPKLLPAHLEDAVARFAHAPELAALVGATAEAAHEEEALNVAAAAAGGGGESDDDDDETNEKAFVCKQVVDLARALLEHRFVDEVGKVAVADAVDGDLVRTARPVAEFLVDAAARCLAVGRGYAAGFTDDGAGIGAAVRAARDRAGERRALVVAAQLLGEKKCFAGVPSEGAQEFLDFAADGADSLMMRASASADYRDRDVAVHGLGRRCLVGDGDTAKRLAPLLWDYATQPREVPEVRGRAIQALCDVALAFGAGAVPTKDGPFLDGLLKLLGDGDVMLVRVAAEGAAKLLLRGALGDGDKPAKALAALVARYCAAGAARDDDDENFDDDDDDDDEDGEVLGSAARLQQVLAVFFPTFARRSGGAALGGAAAALLDDRRASSAAVARALAYVSSLPAAAGAAAPAFVAQYELCHKLLATVGDGAPKVAARGLALCKALGDLAPPADPPAAALLGVLAGRVARAADAQPSAAAKAAAKAAARYADACAAAAGDAAPDAGLDGKNLLGAVADAADADATDDPAAAPADAPPADAAPAPDAAPPAPATAKKGPRVLKKHSVLYGDDDGDDSAETDDDEPRATLAPPPKPAPAAPPPLTTAEVAKFTVPQLKAQLDARGLATTGLKAALKQRLLDAL